MPGASVPIRIGYCLSLTGPIAGNSRSARLAHDIWREDINNRGGLLGRPVELVCYDDHADASRVPGLYQRLMDDDKVDLVIGGYGTNSLLPAMPLIMERQRFFVGLMGLGANNAQSVGGSMSVWLTGTWNRVAPRPWCTAMIRHIGRVSPCGVRSAVIFPSSSRPSSA